MNKKLIACCGLNCEVCDAYIATVNNDDELRKKTAEAWQKMFNVPAIPYESINCTGCREKGAKISHCSECQVRNCVISKGFETCADCDELDTCKIVAQIHQYSQEALENLKKLN
jgi:hypothetical protein